MAKDDENGEGYGIFDQDFPVRVISPQLQFLLAVLLFHDPAGKYRDQDTTRRQHHVGGKEIDQLKYILVEPCQRRPMVK